MEMNQEKRPIRRNAEIRVKVDPEMELALAEIAKARGLPPATLAAVVIGEYVESFYTKAKLSLAAIQMAFQSPEVVAALERAAAHSTAAMTTPEALEAFARFAAQQGDALPPVKGS